MNEIRAIDGLRTPTGNFSPLALAGPAASGAGAALEDRVEISELARVLNEAIESPDDQFRRIADIRASIARGDYLTDDKLNTALSRAIEDL